MDMEEEEVPAECNISWKNVCLAQCLGEDNNLIDKFLDEEGLNADNKTLLGDNIAEDAVEKILENPILDFEDMMLRMQDAIIVNIKKGRAKAKLEPSTKPPEEVTLCKNYADEGYTFSDNDMNKGIPETDICVAPVLLDVKKTTSLFRKGKLDALIEETKAEANNLQRQLILALEGPEADAGEENKDDQAEFRARKFGGKRISPEEVISLGPNKRPSIPQLHPLNANVRKGGSVLSPRAQVIPSPNSSGTNDLTPRSNPSLSNSSGPPPNRKYAIAVRKNPTLRSRSLPQVPQRVTVRPIGSTESSLDPTVVSVKSLQKSPSNIQSPSKGIVSPSVINLPSGITVLPAQPDQQGVLYPGQSLPGSPLKAVATVSAVPAYRPASARKSPHKSTMYTNNPIPIQPKTSEVVQASQYSNAPAQPTRFTIGHSVGISDPSDSGNVDDTIDEGGPRIVSAVGGVSNFISKLNAKAKEVASKNEERSPEKSQKTEGSWLLGCQTCGTTYPLLHDSKYRQHLMVEHSIEVDDKEIHSIKFFAKVMYKCRTCQASFFRNREDHHSLCSPLVPIDQAFDEMPFIPNPNQKEIIKCGICHSMFDTRINLRQHLEENHREYFNFTLVDPKYRCSRCLKVFENSAALTSHVVTCRANQSSKDSILEIARSLLKCEICLRTHEKISEAQCCYTEKKLIRCMLCLYTCISRQNFSRHMQRFHRRNHIGIACPFCPNSEVAPVRAQFEHIVSYHYTTALQEDNEKQRRPVINPPIVAKNLTVQNRPQRFIRLPHQGPQVMHANTYYRRDETGNFVPTTRPPLTTVLRPVNLRPMVVPNNAMRPGGGGLVRYIVTGVQGPGGPTHQIRQVVTNPQIRPRPISIRSTADGTLNGIVPTIISGSPAIQANSISTTTPILLCPTSVSNGQIARSITSATASGLVSKSPTTTPASSSITSPAAAKTPTPSNTSTPTSTSKGPTITPTPLSKAPTITPTTVNSPATTPVSRGLTPTPVSKVAPTTTTSGSRCSTPVSRGPTPIPVEKSSTPISVDKSLTPVKVPPSSDEISSTIPIPVSKNATSIPDKGEISMTPVSKGPTSTSVSSGTVTTPVNKVSTSTPVSSGTVSTPVTSSSTSNKETSNTSSIATTTSSSGTGVSPIVSKGAKSDLMPVLTPKTDAPGLATQIINVTSSFRISNSGVQQIRIPIIKPGVPPTQVRTSVATIVTPTGMQKVTPIAPIIGTPGIQQIRTPLTAVVIPGTQPTKTPTAIRTPIQQVRSPIINSVTSVTQQVRTPIVSSTPGSQVRAPISSSVTPSPPQVIKIGIPGKQPIRAPIINFGTPGVRLLLGNSGSTAKTPVVNFSNSDKPLTTSASTLINSTQRNSVTRYPLIAPKPATTSTDVAPSLITAKVAPAQPTPEAAILSSDTPLEQPRVRRVLKTEPA